MDARVCVCVYLQSLHGDKHQHSDHVIVRIMYSSVLGPADITLYVVDCLLQYQIIAAGGDRVAVKHPSA